jgi:glutathione peroxidase
MLRWISSLFAAQIAVASAADLTSIPFKTIAGEETSLADFKGKVVLIVNTASKCGLTGQYAGLEKLYDTYKDQGFVILGFPCNDFMGQEPGTHEEIVQFCQTKFDVSFPLMAKIHVKGKNQHPLYTALTGPQGAFPGKVKWNFGKFLIAHDGTPLARFEPRDKPESPELVKSIEKALAAGK